jgi:hypothetical protein
MTLDEVKQILKVEIKNRSSNNHLLSAVPAAMEESYAEACKDILNMLNKIGESKDDEQTRSSE